MLPKVYPGAAPVSEYWISEKLDGVRGHWDGNALWTRSGYPIHAPAWFTYGWPTTSLDGELWIGRNRFDDGRRFRVGSGLSDADRALPPPLGSWVTYRYNGLTSTGLPRFARFLSIRSEIPDRTSTSAE